MRLLSLFRLSLLTFAIFFLTACSSFNFFSDDSDNKTSENNASYTNPKQLDHWLDNASAWRNWDINGPNNALAQWQFEDNALSVHLQASGELNSFNNLPHILHIKVIQLTDITGLNTLIKTSAGVRTILSESIEMIPNAVSEEIVTLAPNQTLTLNLARQQDAKFIAVVSGFAELKPTNSVKILSIPIITIKAPQADKSWFDTLTFGLFSDEAEQIPDIIRPATIKIQGQFGDTAISKFDAQAF